MLEKEPFLHLPYYYFSLVGFCFCYDCISLIYINLILPNKCMLLPGLKTTHTYHPNGAVCILLKLNEICTGSHSEYPETSREFSANELMH